MKPTSGGAHVVFIFFSLFAFGVRVWRCPGLIFVFLFLGCVALACCRLVVFFRCCLSRFCLSLLSFGFWLSSFRSRLLARGGSFCCSSAWWCKRILGEPLGNLWEGFS